MANQTEIHRKSESSRVEERKEAVALLRYSFQEMPDKQQAWEDILRLTRDADMAVRVSAAVTLSNAIPYLNARKEEWSQPVHNSHGRHLK